MFTPICFNFFQKPKGQGMLFFYDSPKSSVSCDVPGSLQSLSLRGPRPPSHLSAGGGSMAPGSSFTRGNAASHPGHSHTHSRKSHAHTEETSPAWMLFLRSAWLSGLQQAQGCAPPYMFIELFLEGLPLHGPVTHDLQNAFCQTHGSHTVVDSSGSKAALGNFKAPAFTCVEANRT